MFIVEVMLVVFVGTVTYIICRAAEQKNLAIMAKLLTVFICIDILIRVVVPVFYEAKTTMKDFQKKGVILEWLKEQLKDPELKK